MQCRERMGADRPVLGAGGYILPFGLPASAGLLLYAGDARGPVVATRFTPGVGGLISKADIATGTTLAAGKAIVVGIYSGDGSTLLTSGRLVASAAGKLTFTLSPAVTLAAGTTYI